MGYGYPPHPHFPVPGRSRSRSRSQGRRKRGKGNGKGGIEFEARKVPKNSDLGQKFHNHEGPPVTAMLRNIPNKYTQENLLEELEAEGFSGTYNFFYLPIDVKNSANVGYAFINFLDNKDFERFCTVFDGWNFKRSGSIKIGSVNAAVVQGLKQNVQNLMKKRVAQGEYGPVLIIEGQRTSFEDGAKKILSG